MLSLVCLCYNRGFIYDLHAQNQYQGFSYPVITFYAFASYSLADIFTSRTISDTIVACITYCWRFVGTRL